MVALFTRAWIEIKRNIGVYHDKNVALFTRAWIEIFNQILDSEYHQVALFTRAWIEIPRSRGKTTNLMSPSSRGRGLK